MVCPTFRGVVAGGSLWMYHFFRGGGVKEQFRQAVWMFCLSDVIHFIALLIDEVKLAVAPCGSSEKNCWGWEGVSIFRSVCANRPQENDWMTGVWMTCVLVADVSEATWCWAGCGPGWSNACVFCRRGCHMSLMCNPLSCGTVLCCRISMASQTRLVWLCGMDVMRLLSSQLILCCCCSACFTMAD